MAQLSDLIDPAFLDGLEGWSLADVRAKRDAATEVESGLSYVRRIVQGRLDIVVAEQNHREHGERADVSDLVEELPSILSGNVHAPGLGRLPTVMAPGKLDEALEQRLEEILPASRLADLPGVDDADLSKVAEELKAFERTVSDQRGSVFKVLDQLEAEIVRRYRDGEASVDSLLP